MYGSECWVINKKGEIQIKIADMRTLRWMCGVTRMDTIMNEYIR